MAGSIEHDDRNGIVALNDIDDKREVGGLIGLLQFMHGLRPKLHLGTLFFLQITNQQVRHQQGGDSYQHRCHHQPDFHLSYSVSPLHTSYINVKSQDLLYNLGTRTSISSIPKINRQGVNDGRQPFLSAESTH